MRWPIDDVIISQDYSTAHPAVDLAAAHGTPIKSPESGTITQVNNDPNGYFGGRFVVVKGDSGHRHYMGHNSLNHVQKSQPVREGQIIAAVGDSGFAIPAKGISAPTGPHTHYEVSKGGKTVNPVELIGKGDSAMTDKEAHDLGVYVYRTALHREPESEAAARSMGRRFADDNGAVTPVSAIKAFQTVLRSAEWKGQDKKLKSPTGSPPKVTKLKKGIYEVS